MNELLSLGTAATATAEQAALSLLLAFGLAQAVAAGHVWTFRGMSCWQGLVHAIVIGSIIVCMLLLAYQVRLGDPKDRAALVRELERLPGIQDVSLLLQGPTVEL